MTAADLQTLADELGLDAVGVARAEPYFETGAHIAGESLPPGATPHVSLVDWLCSDPNELRARFDRLFVPGNDGRRLQLSALVGARNVGGEEERRAVAAYLDHDGGLRDAAKWPLAPLEERDAVA